MSRPSFASLAVCAVITSCNQPSAEPAAPAASAAAASAAAPSATTSAAAVATAQPAAAADASVDRIPASGGEIEVRPIQHGSLLLSFAGKHVFIDPWSAGPLPQEPKADLILITDIHGDHLDPVGVERVKGPSSVVVGPQAVADQLPGTQVLKNGEQRLFAGISVEAVPMYNLPRAGGGELRHPPGRGNGYVLSLGGKRVYVSGDTACTPEMKALKNIDVAFVCMNMPYTMPPEEAASCVAAFKPKVVYPYHFRGSDLALFQQPLANVADVEVRLRRWYP
jgi:L-ascorbate metabolism protein UlaG (beta-lactamase superfamily)